MSFIIYRDVCPTMTNFPDRLVQSTSEGAAILVVRYLCCTSSMFRVESVLLRSRRDVACLGSGGRSVHVQVDESRRGAEDGELNGMVVNLVPAIGHCADRRDDHLNFTSYSTAHPCYTKTATFMPTNTQLCCVRLSCSQAFFPPPSIPLPAPTCPC